ncbi:MAG: peptidoglycan -binding protein [Proteobacteria bacterium]|nr:peptidoglycan -binding protein [Pseudomonadota bacterium]MDA1058983.1 peptidoglycan -binding protein [Pseudomonadota bacterium]
MAFRTRTRSQDYWPGFVDALAALLVVIIFLLVVFVLAQVFLSQALSGRDEALQRLTTQINELTELLSLERQGNADLRLNVAQLSASLQSANEERDNLVIELSDLRSEAGQLNETVALLTRRAETAERNLADAQGDLAAANDTAVRDRETIRAQLADVERLQRDIDALRVLRADLEKRVGELVTALDTSERSAATLQQQSTDLENALEETRQIVGTLRDTERELQAKLATEEERTLLAQRDLRDREARLAEVQALFLARESALEEEQELSTEAKARVSLLNQQIALLREQLRSIQAALDLAESRDNEQRVVISDLGSRLNQALAQKVEELSRYRSEFFGRLREVLGERRDIQIVGDRFVFQSEVLFGSGSAELGEEGRARLRDLADTLIEIIPRIPAEISWILRVDGHTDSVPINSSQFPSNWELSGARATNVVKFLVEAGIPAERLAAAGFGQYHPLDDGNDEIAFRRNRRIEMKLTER